MFDIDADVVVRIAPSKSVPIYTLCHPVIRQRQGENDALTATLCYCYYEMDRTEDRVRQIIKQLVAIKPYRIILFGSGADSAVQNPIDIDLLVILDSNSISRSYEERMANKLLVRRKIYALSKETPIDLLVYTKAEYELIRENPNV